MAYRADCGSDPLDDVIGRLFGEAVAGPTVESATLTPTATATATATPRATATPTPVPTVPGYPLSQRTGIAELDAVLDVLERGDGAQIARLIEYAQVPCDLRPPGKEYVPPCPDGRRAGTLVAAYPKGGGCEGGYVTPDVMAAFAPMLVPAGSKLYAVAAGEPSPHDWEGNTFPKGQHRVVLTFPSPSFIEQPVGWNVVEITAGRIVSNTFWCGEPVEWAIRGVPAAAFVLPPP